MSWFTAAASAAQPPCPRCGKPQFVGLVRYANGFAIFNCAACPTPVNTRGNAS